jgi:hypothetical protein
VTLSELIETLAVSAYRRGIRPLDFAEELTASLTELEFRLADKDPAASQLARRIVGGLLDAGWTMPDHCGGCGRQHPAEDTP